jgi:trimeric autotransporter adhesin
MLSGGSWVHGQKQFNFLNLPGSDPQTNYTSMNRQPIILTVLVTTLLIVFQVSCKKDSNGSNDNGIGADTTFVTNSKDTSFSNAVLIKYAGTSATVTNPFEGAGVIVTITNGNVVVTSTVTATEIYYVLSGIVSEGSFKLYSDYKFNLVLNGVSITNNDGPAINIQSGKKVSVWVLNGTNNRLIDGSSYATSTEDQKAAFFSEGQLLFNGNGVLAVTGNYKHGICSDDYIAVTDGNIIVTSAVSDGIHANDYFKAEGGTLTITSSGDGIDCEEGYVLINGGLIMVKSVDDGITASYDGTDAAITPYVKVAGGTINVTTTGEKGNGIKSESYTTVSSTGAIILSVSGRGAKGFKTGGNFTLSSGTVTVTTSGAAFYDTGDADIAAAAGVNCDGNFSMTGGTLTITSTGSAGKGITVDGTLAIADGSVSITVSGADFISNGDTSEAKGIKADGALVVNGGVINVSAKDDGIKSETSVQVNAGQVTVSKSTEGIEAPAITLAGGSISVVSSDDCLNATKGNGGESNDGSLLTISGGTVLVSTTGGDGFDSNGSIVMTGGTAIVQGPPSSPEVALDYNGTFSISGGILVAAGPNSGNMIQGTSTSSAQYTVLVKLSGNLAAGTIFNIQDATGTSLVTFAPARTAYYFVYSSSLLQSGSTYKVYTGGSVSGSTNTGGLHTGGTYSGGTQKGSFTVSSKLTTITM